MNEWKKIATQSDIELLIDAFCGFHDSCIVGVNYSTGSFVDENGVMKNGTEQEKSLCISFNSQSVKKTLEMCFGGVRSFGIVGWQDGCFCNIDGCCLKIENGLIIWSDIEDFSIESPINPINPECSYIVASALKWILK